jgi:hypothetical protein
VSGRLTFPNTILKLFDDFSGVKRPLQLTA